MNNVNVDTVPRDPQQILAVLKPGQMIRISSQLGCLNDANIEQQYMTMPPEDKANQLAQWLINYDQQRGAVPQQQAAQMQQPPQQYQQPPQQQQMAPPAQMQPPMGMPVTPPPMPGGAPPMAPPQQVMAPPPNTHVVAPQQPQYQQPPQQQMTAPQPMAPPAQMHQPQGAPPMAPPPVTAPPMPGGQMMAPQPMTAPVAPQQMAPPTAPQQQQMAAPQQPVRSPQTPSDPNNAGQSSAVLQQIAQDLRTLVDAINTSHRGTVSVQLATLRALMAFASSQGVEPRDLAVLSQQYTDEDIQAFVGALGGNRQGKPA